MDSLKTWFVLPGLVLWLFSTVAFSAPVAEQTISGTVVAEGGELGCDHCMVTLLAVGGRPVATAYLDGGGHFIFQPVPPGSYTVHAQIEGFEEINQQVEAGDGFGSASNVMITVARKNGHAAPVNGGIVDVSEFLDAYPKKAVAAFKKGQQYEKEKKDEQAMKSFESA